MTTGKALNGKPYAGNPHVRFDEGEVASAAMPRRGSLLYNIITRRNFLLGSAAITFAGCVSNKKLFSSRPNVKFGVVSDIHITDWASTEILRKTFRYFRDADVDAVMIVGDMADHGILPQLENVAKAWYEVFPNDRGLGGHHVEKLFNYGNHDIEGLRYRDAAMDKTFAVHHLTYEEAAKVQLSVLGLDKCWESCFNEKYDPIYVKNVNGYDFIGGHWDKWDGIHGLEDWFKANVSKINTGKPFFYFQHCTPRNTIYGADSWGDDAGQSVRALSPYANAVAFSGHSHRPLTDLRSYWRGTFTSIGTSSLSYVCLPHGRQNTPHYRENLDCRHGQIVSVYDDRMVIQRRDFIRDEDLDEILMFEMPTKASPFAARATAAGKIPAFAKSAKLALVKTTRGVIIKAPGAFAVSTATPFDYSVKMEFDVPATKGNSAKKSVSKLWFQPGAAMTRARAAKNSLDFTVLAKDIPAKATAMTCSIAPRNCFGGCGAPLTAKLKLA